MIYRLFTWMSQLSLLRASMMYNCPIKVLFYGSALSGYIIVIHSLMVGMSLFKMPMQVTWNLYEKHACDMKVIRKTNATEYDAYQVLFFMSHFFLICRVSNKLFLWLCHLDIWIGSFCILWCDLITNLLHMGAACDEYNKDYIAGALSDVVMGLMLSIT